MKGDKIMPEGTSKAIQYVKDRMGSGDPQEIKNDAANIFAASYDEYNAIWAALESI